MTFPNTPAGFRARAAAVRFACDGAPGEWFVYRLGIPDAHTAAVVASHITQGRGAWGPKGTYVGQARQSENATGHDVFAQLMSGQPRAVPSAPTPEPIPAPEPVTPKRRPSWP